MSPGRWTPTAFDFRCLGRSLGGGLVIALLALAVLTATDSDQPSWWGRLARLAVLSPVFGAIGTALGLGQARSRGEWLALCSLGVSPLRASLGLVAGAWMIAAGGVTCAAVPHADLAALFPAVPAIDWARDGVGWSSLSAGLRLGPGRDLIEWTVPGALTTQVAPLRGWVAAAIAAGGVGLPLWMLMDCGRVERLATGTAALIAQLWAFHVIAASPGRGYPIMIGAAVLAAHAGARTAIRQWRRAKRVGHTTARSAV